MRLGMFDPPAMVPYSRIPEASSTARRIGNWRCKLAEESMVLLKNDGVLPLKGAKRIAVVGPLADQTDVLLGNYHGTPTHTVSVLEGMRAAFPARRITYVPGTQFLSPDGDPVPAGAAERQRAVSRAWTPNIEQARMSIPKSAPTAVRVEAECEYRCELQSLLRSAAGIRCPVDSDSQRARDRETIGSA